MLIVAIAVHIGCAVLCFAGDESLKSRIPGVATAEPWLWPALGVCCIVDGLLLMVVLGWQKWGFFAACVMAVVEAALIYQAGVNWVVVLAVLGISALWLAVLYGLLQIGGPRSMWAQME